MLVHDGESRPHRWQRHRRHRHPPLPTLLWVLDAFTGSSGRPGQSLEQAALAAAREEAERLRATVAEQAVVIHLAEGKSALGRVS